MRRRKLDDVTVERIRALVASGEGFKIIAADFGISLGTVSRYARGVPRKPRTSVTIDGVTQTIAEWADALGLNRATLWKRLRRGWPPAVACSAPDRKHAPLIRGVS